MTDVIESSVAKVACADKAEDQPRVEVLSESLCSASELRSAVIAGAIASGVVCAIAGAGLGYLLGLREGKE